MLTFTGKNGLDRFFYPVPAAGRIRVLPDFFQCLARESFFRVWIDQGIANVAEQSHGLLLSPDNRNIPIPVYLPLRFFRPRSLPSIGSACALQVRTPSRFQQSRQIGSAHSGHWPGNESAL